CHLSPLHPPAAFSPLTARGGARGEVQPPIATPCPHPQMREGEREPRFFPSLLVGEGKPTEGRKDGGKDCQSIPQIERETLWMPDAPLGMVGRRSSICGVPSPSKQRTAKVCSPGENGQ